MNTKHPWEYPIREHSSSYLNDNEIPVFLSIIHTKTKHNNLPVQLIFLVIESKTNKNVTLRIVHHCEGFHTRNSDIAEYPLEDKETLIQETKAHLEYTIEAFLEEREGNNSTIDTSIPALIMQEGIVQKTIKEQLDFIKDKTENNHINTKIVEVLEKILVNPNTQTIQKEPKIEKPKEPILSIDEAALVKKFGKKKMDELAKRINFNGLLINKK